ncbi:MAG: DUF3768 domain-containing protein [Beijerinckiaceae bacterium]
MPKSSAAIRELNDRFRKGDASIPGRIMITSGVQTLIAKQDDGLQIVIQAVRDFDDFSKGNDPYAEHDFGAFDCLGARLYWKLDYYAPDMEHGSENPADAGQTVRVMTIMLAEEY